MCCHIRRDQDREGMRFLLHIAVLDSLHLLLRIGETYKMVEVRAAVTGVVIRSTMLLLGAKSTQTDEYRRQIDIEEVEAAL